MQLQKIKWYNFTYATFILGVILLLIVVWQQPESSLFTEQVPDSTRFFIGKVSIDLVVPTKEEAYELEKLQGICQKEAEQFALMGNRCAAYIMAVKSFKALFMLYKRAVLEHLKGNKDWALIDRDPESRICRAMTFGAISASLGFSSTYYLMSIIYPEFLASNLSSNCLSTVYYLCWAKKNNLPTVILKTKERIIYSYGQKVWERIESIALAKLREAEKNQTEFSQSSDKAAFIKDMLKSSKNIFYEDETFDDAYWSSI